jgi:hypothetical protein
LFVHFQFRRTNRHTLRVAQIGNRWHSTG